MSEHPEYVEAQLACTSHPINQSNPLADKVGSDLTEEENRFIDSQDGNDNLKRKVGDVSQQIEITML